MGRKNRWQHFRTRGKMPHFCFCKFFYLLLKEDILAVGPGNCRIHLTLIDFSPSSIWKWCLPACLLERSFPLESRNMVWWNKSLAAQLQRLLSEIGYITPLSHTIGSGSWTSKNHPFWPQARVLRSFPKCNVLFINPAWRHRKKTTKNGTKPNCCSRNTTTRVGRSH